jgi:hypothetical protein
VKLRLARIYAIWHCWEEGRFRHAGLGYTPREAIEDFREMSK